MDMPSDEDYRQTKLLKKSGKPLESPFRELADWIRADYGVQVLNIAYDTILVARKNRPRLTVVLDTSSEELRFRDGPLGNFHTVDQNRVRERFDAILLQQGLNHFDTERLLVIFTAFENVARIEANDRVAGYEIDQLKWELDNPDLWIIRKLLDGVTFLFYTAAQAKRYEAKGFKSLYAAEYARVVQRYDEFGYLQKRGVHVRFGSKEDFDGRCQGNWFYFDRG
jgi:hypothetical protein